GAGGAAEEQRVLAVSKNEQLRDLVPEALRVERGGDQGEAQESPQVAAHGLKKPRCARVRQPRRCLERRAEPLPLRFLLAQERDEARIAANVVEERIPLEQRIAREPPVGRRPEPKGGRVRPVQQCVRQSNV